MILEPFSSICCGIGGSLFDDFVDHGLDEGVNILGKIVFDLFPFVLLMGFFSNSLHLNIFYYPNFCKFYIISNQNIGDQVSAETMYNLNKLLIFIHNK